MSKGRIITAIILLILLSPYLYMKFFGCLRDYRETLKEIGKPMQENVLIFFKEHQRYPSLEETVVLLEKAGCANIRIDNHNEHKDEKGKIYSRRAGYDCDFYSLEIGFGATVGDLSVVHDTKPYGFGFSKGNSRCSVDFYADGTVDSFLGFASCYQDACLRWSH